MKSPSPADFKSLFEAIPGALLVITPGLTVLAANDAYHQATFTEKHSLAGRHIDEVLQHNFSANGHDAIAELKACLQDVIVNKRSQQTGINKITLRKAAGEEYEKHWCFSYTPVLDDKQELQYIIQHITDLTESQKEIEVLKKTERDYQLVVNSVNEYAIFIIDPEGKITSWNSGAERIKGYTAPEIIGKPLHLLYTAEDIANRVPEKNLESAAASGHFEAEGWRLRKNGDLFWANVVITALLDEKGVLYGYLKITRDITEKKKAQDQVELLNRQINQSNDAIYTVDAASKIRSWNKGAQKVYGFSEEEVLGKDSNMLLRTALTPEQIRQIVNEIAITDYWSGEIKRKKKNGNDIYVLSSNSTIRDRTGAITGYTAVSFDITEQKRLQEQVSHLAAIVEQSSEAIISRGFDQRLLSWNKGAELLFGYTKEEAIGKTPLELGFVQISKQELIDVWDIIVEKGTWQSEKTFYHKSGSSFIGTVSASAVKNEYGEVSSLMLIIKDISLQRQLEDRLKKHNEELEEKVRSRTAEILRTESRFRTLIENSHDIISLMDESFNIIYRSPSALRITGWSNEEMHQQDGMKNLHPDDIEKAKKLYKSVLKQPGKSLPFQLRNKHRDGHYIWIEGVVTNLLHDEYVQAIVSNARDITERIEAEEKRRATENRFRALIENSNDIITLMDASFKLIYRSPAAVKVLGWTNEDMIGVLATTNIHPDDQQYAAEVVQKVFANPGKITNTQFRMKTKSGSYVWLEGTLTNLLHDDSVRAVVFNFRNITERIEAEEKLMTSETNFRATLDNMMEGVQIIGYDWRYLYVNHALLQYSHVSPEQLLGHTVMESFPGVEQTELFRTLKRCMEKRVPAHIETEFVFPDGTRSDFELSIRPVPEGIFILSIDITEKKKTEEAIKRSNERFELVIAATNDVIWDWDMRTDAFWRNQNYYSLFGYDAEAPDANSSAWHAHIHPDDKERVIKGINKVISDKHHFWSDEYRYVKADHTIAHVMDCGYVLYTNESKAYRMVGAMLDITGRKKSEEALQKSYAEKEALSERLSIILNTLPATIALLDNTGIIKDVNDAWRRFGEENNLTGKNYCIGDNYITVAENAFGEGAEDGQAVANGIKAVLTKKIHEFVYEYPCHSPAGQRWFRMVVTPLYHEEYGGAVVMHTDISELRRLEQERLKSKTEEQRKITQAMLQGQEKERSAIGAELHDNVNQILVATKLLLSISKKDPEKSQSIIGSSIDNIQKAIDENRKIAHELVAPDMRASDFHDELLKLTTEMLSISGIDVVIDTKDLSEEQLDDQRKLAAYRILQEQCTNIVKYAGAKKVIVSLHTSDNTFTMRITDNGKGMEPNKITNGIGLRNIKGRLTLFNGSITIDTAPGKGFVLEVTIPLE